MDEERRIPDGQEAHRRGRVGVGEGRAREVDEAAAEPPELESLECRSDHGDVQARPVSDLGRRGQPEAREVAADEQVERVVGCHVLGPDPVLSAWA